MYTRIFLLKEKAIYIHHFSGNSGTLREGGKKICIHYGK